MSRRGSRVRAPYGPPIKVKYASVDKFGKVTALSLQILRVRSPSGVPIHYELVEQLVAQRIVTPSAVMVIVGSSPT